MIFKPDSGAPETKIQVFKFKGPGVMMGMYNTDASIAGFAHACFKYGL
jgi:isocitrate dehydrogenase